MSEESDTSTSCEACGAVKSSMAEWKRKLPSPSSEKRESEEGSGVEDEVAWREAASRHDRDDNGGGEEGNGGCGEETPREAASRQAFRP